MVAGALSCAILSGVTGPGPAARGRRPGHPGSGGAPDRRPGARAAGTGQPTGRPAGAGQPGERAAGSGQPGGTRTARRHRAEPDRFAPPYRIVTLRTPDGPLRAQLHPHRTAPPPRGGPLARFVRTWGWRAYALPVLTVLTVVCGMDLASGSPAPRTVAAVQPDRTTAAPTPAPPTPTSSGIFVDDGGAGTARPLPPTALPAGGTYAQRGGGSWAIVPGTSKVYGSGPVHRFTVEVEAGVEENGPAFAAAVETTLSDPHSWTNGGRASFQRIDRGTPDFRISLTASLTVRKLCGYDLPYETSCYNGGLTRVVINDARWARGAVAYGGDLARYRLYVINHEVGHALGNGHVQCPKKGALAPVMMQQTLGISTAGVGACKPNPWPYP
jgi:Protein of unknown function (DUF3152)